MTGILQIKGVTVKRIPGFPGYAVSPCGHLFSQLKCGPSPLQESNPWRKLTDYEVRDETKGNRVQFSLKTVEGKFVKVFRAVAVLSAWIGPRPKGYFACHNDGDPMNDNLANLRWDTPKGNEADKLIHGTHQNGEQNCQCKLKESQVMEIRSSNEHPKSLAERHGVHETTIYDIRNRRSWKHLA